MLVERTSEAAEAAGQAALELLERQGDEHAAALTRADLGRLALDRGDLDRAHELLRGALAQLWECGDRTGLPRCLEAAAALCARRPVAHLQMWAAKLLGVADAIRDSHGLVASPAEREAAASLTDLLRARVGAAALAAARAEGSRLPWGAACALPPPPSAAEVDTRHAGDERFGGLLTPREQEVAVLVSQGMTNRQIARRLRIAEWTAINHVRHIMRKLDCRSRLQVAQWVARQGR
jgi:DNA-binding CsgD family transcriptional regulator